MLYVSATFAVFPFSRDVVYRELTDMAHFPDWGKGLVSLSPQEAMREGMRFKLSSHVCASLINATVAVERLVPNELLELVSKTGLISFRVMFNCVENSPIETEVICTMRFEFNGFVFNASRSVIEAMARQRCQRDLLALRTYIMRTAQPTSAKIATQSNRPQ